MHDAACRRRRDPQTVDRRSRPYRDHLLRLDRDSRRSRFGGGVSDDFIAIYVELARRLDAVVHGFFVDGVLRGAAELRPLGQRSRARRRPRSAIEKPLAEPRRRLGPARPHAARRAQPRHQVPAHGLPRRQPAHAAAGAQIRRRTELRFRQRGRRGRGAASDAAVGAARIRGRRPWLCAPPSSTCSPRLLQPASICTPRADRPPRPRKGRRRPRRATRTARSATPRTAASERAARRQIFGDLPARRSRRRASVTCGVYLRPSGSSPIRCIRRSCSACSSINAGDGADRRDDGARLAAAERRQPVEPQLERRRAAPGRASKRLRARCRRRRRR